MKKAAISILVLIVLLFTSANSIIAEPASIDVNISVLLGNEESKVIVPDDSTIGASIEVNTGYTYASVKRSGTPISSTVSEGVVKFNIAGAGTYIITKENSGPTPKKYTVPNTGVR